MAPVQSRLVYAVTIPAAALAIFLSLFWLRRSSKGHPPSPPDIPDKNSCVEENQAGEKVTALTKTKEIKSRGATSHCDSEINVVKKIVESVSVEPVPGPVIVQSIHQEAIEQQKENLFVRDSSDEESVKIIDDKEETSVATLACGDRIDNVVVTDYKQCVVPRDEKEKLTTLAGNQSTVVVEACDTPSEITQVEAEPVKEAVVATKIKALDSSPLLHISREEPSSSAAKMIAGETGSAAVKLTENYHKETDVEKTTDLSEKLASLELDTMKLGGGEVDVKERDSANHSPSENMLASPSMSNFSDAHSEGSSDSGKGHSDGTTSPSRTPAGGSSVSGDPLSSIYEFVIPQVIVGRLIGRYGVFLHEIMSATHTSIFIKVHPETPKLKICAIEGSQQDIDKALEMIRKKFPQRRYPKLTLERVTFAQIQHSQQLRAEDFHLQLIEGVNNDVILSSLLSPGQFFVQQPCHPSYPCLTPFTQTLSQVYSTTDAPPLVNPVTDAICVCPSLGGWYRAQIVSVDEEGRQCDIKFVDYGGYLRVDAILLKQIRADFLMLPFQAVECSLANIQPIHESGWSEEARLFVHNVTFGRVLQAQVVSYSETGIPLVNLYTAINNQAILVNTELVSNGFAVFTTPGAPVEDVMDTTAAVTTTSSPPSDQIPV